MCIRRHGMKYIQYEFEQDNQELWIIDGSKNNIRGNI